jgi:hypothetical protein
VSALLASVNAPVRVCSQARSAWSHGVAVVMLLVLAGAAAAGVFLNSATFSDADGFADGGRVLLSARWQHTYADSWLQAGPFEQLICLLGRTAGVTAAGTPIALNVVGAAALMIVARCVLGRDWKALLYVGVGATFLGIISDLYAIGHPSELFIALSWIVAARAARRDAVLLAGALLGVSAGFETWGLLGAPILFLIPTFRRTVAAGLLALAVAGSIYAPFALGGDFHMFDLHWSIAGGLAARLFGQSSPYTWHMRLAESVIVVAFGSALALALRRRTSAAVWIVPAATSILRLFLDPVRYPYYWDTGLTLILIGTAPWFIAPRAFARRLRATRGRRAVPAT